MRVAIYGAGGHGHDIAATLPDFAGFVDDDPERCELEALGSYELLLGMNDPQVRYRKWRMTLNFPWHDNGVWVHPSANLGPSVKLGQHTHVNAGAFLTRCTVGEFCTIAPNATVLGDVTLGDRVMVGANATIRNLVNITHDVVIGAGAVVTKDITEPGTYVGCPARQLARWVPCPTCAAVAAGQIPQSVFWNCCNATGMVPVDSDGYFIV